MRKNPPLEAAPRKHTSGWATVSRELLVILTVTFVVVLLFIAQLTYRYVQLSDQANLLVRNLQSTFALNQELRSGIQEQIGMLHRQFENPNPLFPYRFSQLNYAFGTRQSRYLTLDIGSEERLTVESIKSLQAEVGVQALQIFDQLRRGERGQALDRMGRVEQLGERLEREFELLNRLQVEKLQNVQGSVAGSLKRAQFAIGSLALSLLIVLALVTLMLRRRVLRPLQALLQASEEIREGNFSVRSPVSREDEFGQLSRSFNFMAQSLAESYAELEREVQTRDRLLENIQAELVEIESVQALSRLIRGAAHELNNPLTAIAGFAELQKMKVAATRRDADEMRVLDDIMSQADRCRRIISNLLLVAHPPHSEELLLGINSVIEPVLQLREYEMKVHNVRVLRDYSGANPPVLVDAYRLRQLVLTLLVAVDQSVRERFSSANVTVRTLQDQGRVTVEIRSSGSGALAGENASEQTSGRRLDRVLPSCSALAERLHAQLHGVEDGGTLSFTVTLPLGNSETPSTAENTNGMLRQ